MIPISTDSRGDKPDLNLKCNIGSMRFLLTCADYKGSVLAYIFLANRGSMDLACYNKKAGYEKALENDHLK